MKKPYLAIYKGAKVMLEVNSDKLKVGEKMVLLLILALFESNDHVTMHQVREANTNVKIKTTYALINGLMAKGLITKQRSNQHYSKTFLTVTDKGLLAAREFRVLFASLSALG